MEIDINQKRISLRAEYKIFQDGKEQFSADKRLFTFFDEIQLFDLSHRILRYRIKQKWAWFHTSYDLTDQSNQTLKFRTLSFWKRHYQCQDGQDTYEIFGHRGRKFSIYKNDVQVAWWNKESVTWFSGDNYKIIADKDSKIELLISFCLITDNQSSQNKEGNAVSIDFGNFGPQAKAFNPNWTPKV